MEKILNEEFNKGVEYRYYATTQEKANKGLIFIDDSDRPAVQYLYTNNEIANGRPSIKTYTQNPEEEKEFRYFLYLASDLDLGSTDYFNFRINIPDDILELNEEYLNEVRSINTAQLSTSKKQQLSESISKKLIYEKNHPYNNHPDAVNIRTPRFHKIVNFYKLVAKSYETRRYAVPNTNTGVDNRLELFLEKEEERQFYYTK